MRWVVMLALCAGGCSFRIDPAGSGEVDAPPFIDDGGGLGEVWSFDTAAELAVSGHERVAMAIEPRGSLTPEGYVYGGLLGRGETNVKLWAHGDTGWGKLATVTPAGTALWTGDELTTGQDLTQFGIRRTAALRTLWFEGEVLLSAGTEQLKLKGDDVAFLELAMPGTSAFAPLLENQLAPTAIITVPTTGWYPVRIGWADGDRSGTFALEIQGPQGFATFAPHRLRASVAAVQGMLRTVFYRQMHGGGVLGRTPPVVQLQSTPLLATTQFAPPLQGSVIDTTDMVGDATDWSARWAGQLYAATPGQYTVRVSSDDGNRLFLGAAPVVEATWARDASNGSSSSTATAALREGWNDLVVDYNQSGGTTRLGVELLTSPDPALVAGPLPLEALRAIEPRGERLLVRSGLLPIALPVADDTGVFSEVPVLIGANANQIVTRVDVTVVYSSESPDQLVFRVIRPGGTPVIVRNHPFVFGGTRLVVHAFSLDPALVGNPADGMWAIGVADDVDGIGNNTTTIAEVHLTLHTSGGPDQIERTATWRTPIKDLGTRLVKIDAITWDDRTPAGTAVELRLRSCAQPDCSDEASWGDALAKGMPALLAQRRYLQAQVTMTSDGAAEAELRSLQISYRRASL
jgi:hypothetical protein